MKKYLLSIAICTLVFFSGPVHGGPQRLAEKFSPPPLPLAGEGAEPLGTLQIASANRSSESVAGNEPQERPVESEVLATEIYDAENLAFDSSGRLFVTAGDSLNLITFNPDGSVKEIQTSIIGLEASFAGIAIGPDGYLYTVCYHKRKTKLLRVAIDEEGFPYTIYLEGQIKAPNGLRFDDDGTLYMSDFGYYLPHKGKIWRVARNGENPAVAGEVAPLVSGQGGVNGIVIDRSSGRIYFSRTLIGKIYYLEKDSAGEYATEPVLFQDIDIRGPRTAIVDDMALDADGNLYVCFYNGNEIRVFSRAGDELERIVPQDLKHPTALAFGILEGDTRTLYVTQKGRMLVHDRHGGDRVARIRNVADPYPLPFLTTPLPLVPN